MLDYDLTNKIKQKAKAIGFDLVGISSAKPFTRAYNYLKKDKKIGEKAELMTNPALHLKECQSIIALAMSYASSSQYKGEDSYIAKYARGQDYHQVLMAKMNLLISYIKTLKKDAMFKPLVDTGFLLDREVAYRAGLGWMGKNKQLINPEYGSYLFLGEILSNLPLKSDQQIEDKCGTCQLCLKACPTKALEKPYSFNSTKCISYLTQKKGNISVKERKAIGENLWGCDSCQDVCPYNQDVPTDLHSEFKEELTADFKQLLNFTKKTIDKKWANSALYWRGLRILKRNTLINIANSKQKSLIPLLKKELNNPSPILREFAVWALEEIKTNT